MCCIPLQPSWLMTCTSMRDKHPHMHPYDHNASILYFQGRPGSWHPSSRKAALASCLPSCLACLVKPDHLRSRHIGRTTHI